MPRRRGELELAKAFCADCPARVACLAGALRRREPCGVWGGEIFGVAGFLAMFFFLTLYMQNVLGYSPLQTGGAYLPVTAGVAVSAGVSSQLLSRIGTRPVIVGGALITAGHLYYLSRIPVCGSYLIDLFPGLVIVSVGVGAVFVAITAAANAGVPADKAGLAAALLNASQQVGAALGLAILSAIATARTNHLLAARTPAPDALTAGFHRALLAGSIFLLATAFVALATTNTREDPNASHGADLEPDQSHTAIGTEPLTQEI